MTDTAVAAVQTAASSFWGKVTAWVSHEVTVVENNVAAAAQAAVPVLSKVEQTVVGILQPLFAKAEAGALQDLISFARGVITSHPNPGSMTLADWETAILMGAEKLGGELFDLAKGLGSNSLQALIGLVLANLPAA